ncbi:MAG: GNAT family N-acetyltransferase [Deltaproteobacteria bacterium]|nr:GNAT family N-acetyltransferase [Deltaproteobacteria bacterium]
MSALRPAAPLNPPLETARLCLEPLVAAHAPGLFAALHDPAVLRFIQLKPAANPAALGLRFAVLAHRRDQPHAERWLQWAIRVKATDTLIGKIDADVNTDEVATNVGYLIEAAAWGQGYATEALAAVLALLDGAGVREQRATVTVGNAASAAVLRRCGFTLSRVLVDNDRVGGVLVDDWEFVRRA